MTSGISGSRRPFTANQRRRAFSNKPFGRRGMFELPGLLMRATLDNGQNTVEVPGGLARDTVKAAGRQRAEARSYGTSKATSVPVVPAGRLISASS
jgi:hypothetical protein